jgi:hypothetical protein
MARVVSLLPALAVQVALALAPARRALDQSTIRGHHHLTPRLPSDFRFSRAERRTTLATARCQSGVSMTHNARSTLHSWQRTLTLSLMFPVAACAAVLPGYWSQPGHICSSALANATTQTCARAAAAQGSHVKMAECCDADSGCGGFTLPDGVVMGLTCSA